jgi:succinylglutamate desuccinylase
LRLFPGTRGGDDQAAMTTSSAFNDSRRRIPFSHERDARVSWLLEMHPVTAAMLVQIGWFPSKNKAL